MLQRFRELLTLILLGLLPFHALLVTVATKLLEGPGHAPLQQIALWKEALLGVILLCAIVDILKAISDKRLAVSRKIDLLDGIIVALFLVSLISIILHSPFSILNYTLGFKYDFVPLVAFLILRRVPWSKKFQASIGHWALIIGACVAAFGLLTFVLPLSFFTALGYSDLHSLYLPDASLPPYHQIGSSWLRRIQGPMSGPNQLGLWLLIPWSLVMVKVLREKVTGYWLLVIGLITAAIFLSFSRAAWISATVIAGAAVWLTLPRVTAKRILLPAFAVLCVAIVALMVVAPSVLLRQASSADHLRRPLQAIQTIIEHPLGLGLGSAGPASNRTSDACVHLEEGSDPSWASDRPELCVFVGTIQVQPVGRACQCPLLPENWYLQIGVELGILGFVLYAILIVLVLRKLILRSQFSILYSSIALAFVGIAISALFLHAWEDAAVAYTVWILLATTVSSSTDAGT